MGTIRCVSLVRTTEAETIVLVVTETVVGAVGIVVVAVYVVVAAAVAAKVMAGVAAVVVAGAHPSRLFFSAGCISTRKLVLVGSTPPFGSVSQRHT